jgi:hypothetical protein
MGPALRAHCDQIDVKNSGLPVGRGKPRAIVAVGRDILVIWPVNLIQQTQLH